MQKSISEQELTRLILERYEGLICKEAYRETTFFYNPDQLFNFAEQVPDNGEKIKSVVCFAIAPENRGKGMATALLKYLC